MSMAEPPHIECARRTHTIHIYEGRKCLKVSGCRVYCVGSPVAGGTQLGSSALKDGSYSQAWGTGGTQLGSSAVKDGSYSHAWETGGTQLGSLALKDGSYSQAW